MEFDIMNHRIRKLASMESETELGVVLLNMASETEKEGLSGLIPVEEGGLVDGYPFGDILKRIVTVMEWGSSPESRKEAAILYEELCSEGVDGFKYRKSLAG